MTGKPVSLTSERPWRTYLGGSQIDRLHGMTDRADTHFPEEWIFSTVTARNPGREHLTEGLSRSAQTGEPLKALLASDPVSMLGRRHAAAFGDSPGILVKLIDAAERLTIQVHPTREAARRLFQSPFGKTECWHILGTRESGGEPPHIYLGFRQGVTRKRWEMLFQRQDIAGMLACLHRFPVRPGDTFLVECGVAHAIGANCLLAEVQEPTDLTLRTEKTTPGGYTVPDAACHQGVGYEEMFSCFEYEGASAEETLQKWKIPPGTARAVGGVCRELIGYARTSCFMMLKYRMESDMVLETGGRFSGVYVLAGEGVLEGDGFALPVRAGDPCFLPASIERCVFRFAGKKPAELLQYFGPA